MTWSWISFVAGLWSGAGLLALIIGICTAGKRADEEMEAMVAEIDALPEVEP